jgi:hypothetical protein
MTHLSNYLPTKLKYVGQEGIQRNAFYVHPENILVSMLTDEERSIRQLAVKTIIIFSPSFNLRSSNLDS